MLLLDKPRRLSTDIDIIVKPGTEVEQFIEKASKIIPFKDYKKQTRKGRNNIENTKYGKLTYIQKYNAEAFAYIVETVNLLKKQ